MKKLFVLTALCLAPLATAPAATKRAHQKKAAPSTETAAPAATPAAPAAPLPRKPGFWERTWVGAKRGSEKVWDATGRTITRPFHGKGGKAGPKAGWRDLAMTITLDPATVKVPETQTLRVKVAVLNHGKQAVQLDFPTSQRVEVVIRDDSGQVRGKASDEQKVDSEQGFLVINPDERLEYTATVSVRNLSAGQNYTLEAFFPNFPELQTQHPFSPIR